MHVFYIPEIKDDLLTLNPEESRHCTKVLRLQEGDEVILTDGKGVWHKAALSEPHPKACVVQITKRQEQQFRRPFHLHMAVAPTKNIARFEWFLEKATECGVDEITPVFCEHSERNVVKLPRLQKIMIAAMKQALRPWLPVLNPALKLNDFLEQNPEGKKFIAHCQEGDKKPFRELYVPGQDVLILIGPEGDFSPEEVNTAGGKGFEAITMGQHRLRTETAALALCIEANFLNNLI